MGVCFHQAVGVSRLVKFEHLKHYWADFSGLDQGPDLALSVLILRYGTYTYPSHRGDLPDEEEDPAR